MKLNMNNKKDTREIVLIVCFVLLITIPFIFKAYHIDDTAYIAVANQIINDPLEPYSFNFDWTSETGLATHISNPPLISYYLAVFILFFGETEWILHISMIIFPIIAALSFFCISKFYIKKQLYAVLLMVSSVSFVVMSHDLMLDVPFLSFFLISIALFIYGIEKDNDLLLLFGSITCSLGYLTKYLGIIIIPILAIYIILSKRYSRLFYLIIPISTIALWNYYTYILYGTPHNATIFGWLLGSQGLFSFESIAIRAITNLVYIGGATIFPLFMLYPFLKSKISKIFYLTIILFSAIISTALYFVSENFAYRYDILQLIQFAFFISTGMFFLIIILIYAINAIKENHSLKRVYENKNIFFLLAWFAVNFASITIIAGGAVRFITLILPQLIIIFMLSLDKYFSQAEQRKYLNLAVILTLLLGLSVSFSDYEYAYTYKDFSSHDFESESVGEIWFVGHSGFQYYMQNKNYRILGVNDNSPKKGDIIIKATIPSPRKFTDELKKRISLIDTIEYDSVLPIRTLNPQARAGFYTYGGGFLPYSFSDYPVEAFYIYDVAE